MLNAADRLIARSRRGFQVRLRRYRQVIIDRNVVAQIAVFDPADGNDVAGLRDRGIGLNLLHLFPGAHAEPGITGPYRGAHMDAAVGAGMNSDGARSGAKIEIDRAGNLKRAVEGPGFRGHGRHGGRDQQQQCEPGVLCEFLHKSSPQWKTSFTGELRRCLLSGPTATRSSIRWKCRPAR